jgi:dTDP-glucose pyrophosphorylase
MKNIKKIKITINTTIQQALKIISNGGFQVAVVVDNRGNFLGTLTDGDIRNGFLKGLNINSSIETIFSKKPIIAKKDYSREKLLKLAISNKIHQIPVVDNNKKVIGIHILDELIEPKVKSNKIVIMAGGMGLRLRPLTKNIPKPMLKVGNKPILQILVEKLKKEGYENFVICVNYKSEIIKNYFSSGKKFGVKIEYIQEKKRMGTAGALSLFKEKPKEPFFVINGDLLTNLNFDKMLDFHIQKNSKATMCITEYNIVSPYGEVKLDNENIKLINEKPVRKVFVNTGVYILDPRCIDLIPNKFYDMPTLFNNIIAKKLKTISFPLGEYWLDIGRLNDLKKANNEYSLLF